MIKEKKSSKKEYDKKYSKIYRKTHMKDKIKNNKEYYQLYKEEKREYDLKKKYNITLEKYNELLTKQNGVCAICLKAEKIIDGRYGKIRDLAVDHDHKTNSIRGLLCSNCNRALGGFQDSILLLESAKQYRLKY